VLGINPFNQPDVEASKIATKALTSEYEKKGMLPAEAPFYEGEGVKLFAFVMIVGVFVGTYSSIYIASPLLLIFGEGKVHQTHLDRAPAAKPSETRITKG